MSLEQIAADLLGVFLVWLPYALQMKCSEEMIFFHLYYMQPPRFQFFVPVLIIIFECFFVLWFLSKDM